MQHDRTFLGFLGLAGLLAGLGVFFLAGAVLWPQIR
jgi:hypothetical protein